MDFWIWWWVWSMLTFGSLAMVNYLFLKAFWMENLAWISILIVLTYGFCFGQWGDLLPKGLFWAAVIGLVVLVITPGWVFFASFVLQRSLSSGLKYNKLKVFTNLTTSVKYVFVIVYLNYAIYLCVTIIWIIIFLLQ